MTVLERNCDQLIVGARLPNLYSFSQTPWRRFRDIVRKIESTLYEKLLVKLPGDEHQEASRHYGTSLGGLANYLDEMCRRLDQENGQQIQQVGVLGQSPDPVTYVMVNATTATGYNQQSNFQQLATGVNVIYQQQTFAQPQLNVAQPQENVHFQLQQVQQDVSVDVDGMDTSFAEDDFSQNDSSNDYLQDLIEEAKSSEDQYSKKTINNKKSTINRNRVRSKKTVSVYKPRPDRARINYPHLEPLPAQEGEDPEMALKRPFKCPTCGLRYINRMNFQRHWLVHLPEEDKRFKCDQCPLKFHFACLLKTHQLHHKEKSVQCPDCAACFALPYELYAHQRNNHQPDRVKPHKCEHCDKRFNKPSELKTHINSKHLNIKRKVLTEKRFKCEVCEKMCWSRIELQNHLERKHSGPKPTYRCDYCGREYLSKKMRDSHMSKVHESESGPLQCGICEASLLTKTDMRVHFQQTHSDHKCDQCDSGNAIEAHVHAHPNPEELTLHCDQCQEKFFDPVGLARHKRKEHFNDDPNKHPCGFCDFICSSENALTIHRRLKHNDQLLYTCEFCGSKFPSGIQLRDHRRRHLMSDDIPCKKCSKRFKTPQELRSHSLKCNSTNTEKGVYVCTECNRKHSSLSLHLKHVRLHKGDLPFECTLCQEKFPSRSKLRHHRDTDHKDELPKLKCTECSMTFSNETQRVKHAFSEHKPTSFNCNHCELKFSTTEEVRKHELTHFESSQLLSCEQCNEKFATKAELGMHRRRHRALTEPKFMCQICGKKYRFEKNLSSHSKIAHSGLELPPEGSEVSAIEHDYAKKTSLENPESSNEDSTTQTITDC